MMPAKKIITDTMNSQELVALLKENDSFGQHKFDETYSKYLKLAKKYSHRKDRVYFKPVSFKCAAGFNYVFRYFKRAANEDASGKIEFDIYVWFYKKRGIYTIKKIKLRTGSNSVWMYQVYTPHFFDRYRERYLKDLTIPREEAMHRFMLNNTLGAVAEIPSKKYPNSVWTRCDEGLLLCTKLTDEIYECKTFISFEMTGFGENWFVNFTAEEVLKIGFEFKLPYENFNDFREE